MRARLVLMGLLVMGLGAAGPPEPGRPPAPEPPASQPDREGTISGSIVWLRSLAGQGEKTGSMAIQVEAGVQISFDLMRETAYSIERADLPQEKARSLLGKDVPVLVNWKQGEKKGDGRVASAVRIRTVEMNGEVRLSRKSTIDVTARMKPPPPETPGISVRGRAKPPSPPTRHVADRPRRLKLGVIEGVSELRINGDSVEAKQLRSRMKFEAIVMDGGPAIVIRLQAEDRRLKRPGSIRNGKRSP